MADADRIVERLAFLLEYPASGFEQALDDCRRASVPMPELAGVVERFAAEVRGLSKSELQELYTETFDLNARCTMDIGWHLFGDRYERGAFLSGLRPQLAAAGIAEGTELPDFLPRLLVLLDRLDPSTTIELRDLVRRAVGQLASALHERSSPYEHLVTSAFAAASHGA